MLLGVLLLVGWPTAAFGHASPLGSVPADGQVLTTSPSELTVTFTEPVTLAGTDNAVLDAAGRPEPATFTVQDTVLRIRPKTPLADGTHVVTWRVVSADSHPVTGGFTFAVGEATPGAIGVPTSQAQRELVVVRAVAEAVRYAGLLGFTGLLAFALVVAPRGVRRHDGVRRAWARTSRVFGVLAVLGTLVLAPLTATWESGERLSALTSAGTWVEGLGSSAGVALVLVSLGVTVASAAQARWPVVAAAGLALALASTLPVGHTRSYGPSWLVLVADLVHVTAGAVWWGGLVGLVIVLAAGSVRVRDRALAVARFSTVAAVVLVALGVAGVVLYWRIAGSVPALWGTGYGRAVLVKVLLVLPVLAVAVWNRRVLLRRVEGRDAAEAAVLLRRSVGAEALLLAGVLVATGALVGQTPPPRADTVVTGVPTVQRLALDLAQDRRATVVVAPVRRGTNAVQVAITDGQGEAVDLDAVPRLQVSLEDGGIGPLERPLVRTGPGRWEGTVEMTLPGTWRMSFAARLTRFDEPVVHAEVDVP